MGRAVQEKHPTSMQHVNSLNNAYKATLGASQEIGEEKPIPECAEFLFCYFSDNSLVPSKGSRAKSAQKPSCERCAGPVCKDHIHLICKAF